MLLLPLLAHHFFPHLVTVAHTLLSLTAEGEKWQPGQAVPQVTPIFIIPPTFWGALAAELNGRSAPFPGCSSTLVSSHHAQSVLLVLFSLLIFGPEVSFQNSSRVWK